MRRPASAGGPGGTCCIATPRSGAKRAGQAAIQAAGTAPAPPTSARDVRTRVLTGGARRKRAPFRRAATAAAAAPGGRGGGGREQPMPTSPQRPAHPEVPATAHLWRRGGDRGAREAGPPRRALHPKVAPSVRTRARSPPVPRRASPTEAPRGTPNASQQASRPPPQRPPRLVCPSAPQCLASPSLRPHSRFEPFVHPRRPHLLSRGAVSFGRNRKMRFGNLTLRFGENPTMRCRPSAARVPPSSPTHPR
mmetsp:Transcript_62925/g.150012  ORF Transcript_62925/g.150012 Transcript_62925/m.150012 type:complete len:250 (-) Transcript_62925:85-834(-)